MMETLKTVLMALVGFGLLWLALVAEVAGQECVESIPAWGGIEGTGPPTDWRPVCTAKGGFRAPPKAVAGQRKARCTGDPYWGPGCEAEMFKAHAAVALARADGNECDLAYRRLLGMPRCTRMERELQEVR